MSATDVDLGAIRRVSAGHGDVEQRIQDAETLGNLDATDRRVLRALVQGLWDEDPDVRSACETALRTQFRATDADGRKLFVDVLFVSLAGDADPPREVVSLLFHVVGWIRRHRTEEPTLFATVLAEAERSRSGGSYPQPVRRALKRLYKQSPNDDSQSTAVVDRFNRRRSLDQLRSETAPPGEVEDALRFLGDRPFEEASLEMVLYHLLPLRISHNYQVMNRAVGNLHDWTAELPGDDLLDLKSAVETLKEYRRRHRETLPGHLRNEIALAEVAIDVLSEELQRLSDLPRYDRVVPPLLDALEDLTGVRDHLETIATIASSEDGAHRSEAIDVLRNLLAGLDTDIRYNRHRIRETYEESTAEADEEIRELLERLATDPTVDEDDARESIRALIRSRPEDLAERIADLLDDSSVSDGVVETALDTVADEAVLSATDAIVDAFERGRETDLSMAIETADALERLGHDPARRTLETAMEEESGPVASKARESLIKSGYYEQVRSSDTRSRSLDFARRSESAEDDRTDAEDDKRSAKRTYKRIETRFREQVFEADRTIGEGLVDVLEYRIDSLDTLVELYQADRQLEGLLDRIASRHDEIATYLNRVALGDDVRQGIEEEFASIETDIEYLEGLAETAESYARDLDAKLDELKGHVEDDGDDPDAALRRELRKRERESLRTLRDRYRSVADERSDRASELRAAYERRLSELANASIEGVSAGGDIQQVIDTAQGLAGRIETLTAQRGQDWDRIVDAVDRIDSEIAAEIDDLEDTAGEIEDERERIDDLTKRIADLRLEQHHESQRSKEQKATHRQIEPRSRGDAKHRHEVALERRTFFKYRQVYAEFIRLFYETQLERIGDHEFQEEYGDRLDRITEEIEEHQ